MSELVRLLSALLFVLVLVDLGCTKVSSGKSPGRDIPGEGLRLAVPAHTRGGGNFRAVSGAGTALAVEKSWPDTVTSREAPISARPGSLRPLSRGWREIVRGALGLPPTPAGLVPCGNFMGPRRQV